MPLDPVLDIYNIRISRRKNKKESCFRELLQLKFNREESVRDEELFTLFTNKFIYNLDTEDCYQIEGSKKVLTIKPCDTEGNIKKFDPRFKPEVGQFTFSGILHAGKYGESTYATPVKNKNKQQIVPKDVALTKEFFFFITIPMNSHKGILMIQSYSGISYLEQLTNYLNKFFFSDSTYCITRYIPIHLDSLRDKIKNKISTKSITYLSKTEKSSSIGDNGEKIILGEYEISINIRPIRETANSIESIDEQFETIVQDKGNRPWYKKIWAKNNETGQHCSYFLDNADSLKPRISLSSEIKVNDDGTFESNDLYLYCKKILPEIRNIIERAQ